MRPEEILEIVNNADSLDVLADILDLSRETRSPDVRKIVIQVPEDTTGVPEGIDLENQLPSMVATALFHQLVANPGSPDDSSLEVLGQRGRRARLPGGGVLKLRVNENVTPVRATIIVSDYVIPGYEGIQKIRFVVRD
ncbi:MAG: hypothetical protein F6K31_33045 [Symploca sp. SIO2G7]|nr:hypothetical protein [Symploca sp. SIO2G7]